MSYVDFTDKQALMHALVGKSRTPSKIKKSKLKDLFQATIVTPETELSPSHKPIFDWLRRNNYNLVVDLIEEHKLPLSLLCGNSPALIEQLVILDLTLLKHAPTHRNEIIGYAQKLVRTACAKNDLSEINNTHPLALQTLEKLGKLSYVIQNDTKWIENGFNESYLEAYETHCSSLFGSLQEIGAQFENTGVQSAHDALSTRLPLAIAKQLLTSDGYVNLGLLEVWTHQSHLSETNYGHTIKERLGQLLESPKARSAIFQIKIRQPESLIHQVIKTSLNLPSETILNDQHGRVCALTALLSNIRQSPSYSCFSLVICISQLASSLESVLENFHGLLASGKLQRKIGRTFHDFPFLLAMANKNLNKPLKIDKEGRIKGASDFLWNSPGIQAACLQMGINDPQSAIKGAINTIDKKSLTTSNILHTLAKQQTGLTEKQVFDLYRKGCFVFEAQTNNALLAAWSNAVASMAEGKLSGVLKSELLSATMWGLDVSYKGLNQEKMFLKQALEEEIIKNLIAQIHYFYDPLISDQSISGNTKKQYGGFVLYERNQTTDPSTWIRLDSPEAFKTFISKVIIESGLTIKSQETSQEDKELINRMTKNLSSYAHTTNFLDRLLPQYMQQRFPFIPSENLNKVTQTPWVTVGGNDTESTLQIYINEEKLLKTHKIQPSNACSLLELLVTFGRHIYISHSKLFHPRSRTIARISGLHAFNITLGHPSLDECWKDSDIKAWINKRLVESGRSTENTILSKQTKKKIGSYICRKMLQTDKKARGILRSKIEELESKLSLASFSLFVRSILSELKPTLSKEDRNAKLDTIILGCLPKSIRDLVTKNCIHIADSNWSLANQDVHFCVIYNPCSSSIELWKCGDKNKNFEALNQETWVKGQDWELLYF